MRRCANLAPLGVGINLQPTAVRELTELGLGDVLSRDGHRHAARSTWFNKFGQFIHERAKGACGWIPVAANIRSTADNCRFLLLRAVRERIGADNFRSGLRLVSFEQTRDEVSWFAFLTRNRERTDVDEGDILVGADGIHSAVRHQLYPAEGEPRFAQQILWRAAIEAEPFLGGQTMVIAGHFHQRIVVYPIGTAAKRANC